jgi:hypothetical protein
VIITAFVPKKIGPKKITPGNLSSWFRRWVKLIDLSGGSD